MLVALSRGAAGDCPYGDEVLPIGESVGRPVRGPGGGGNRIPYGESCEAAEEDDVSMFSSPTGDTGSRSSRAGISHRTVAGDADSTGWRWKMEAQT